MILARVPTTLTLAASATLFSLLVGVAGGIYTALRQLFDLIIPEATYIYTVHANYVSASRANVRNWEQLPATLVRYANVWIER